MRNYLYKYSSMSKLVGLIVTLLAGSTFAAKIKITPVTFGNYNVYSGSDLQSNGNVTYDCKTSAIYTMSLDGGNYGSISQRKMQISGGTATLDYNLYTNVTRTTIWGDGTNGSTLTGNCVKGPDNFPIYGSVTAGQDATVGSYSDSVTITLTY